MAMLGKRFQRTISMSQIGPSSSSLHSDKSQAHPSPTPPSPACADPLPKFPLILHDSSPQKTNEQLLLQAAATQWDAMKARQQAEDHHRQQHHHHNHHHHHHHPHLHHDQTAASNPWEALKSFGSGAQQDDLNASKQPGTVNQSEILKNAEAMMVMMMMQQNSSHGSSARSCVKGDDSQESHLHLGLSWPHPPANPSSSPCSSSRAHFLDACFLCKRRLRHERDIFIYRGDIAFCSEECRHRQILIDETRSSRATRKGGGTLETTP